VSIYSDDTRRLISRDVAALKANRERKRKLIIDALNAAELTDEEAVAILESTLTYGWRLPDGEWRSSPKFGARP
jgi:hypothetical protein